MPDDLPLPITSLLKKTINHRALESGYKWVLDHLPDTGDANDLMELFLKRYEDQIVKLSGNGLAEYRSALQAILTKKTLELLSINSRRFVDVGANPLFVRTWLQKRLLSVAIGISMDDIDRRARSVGRKLPDYLSDQISTIVDKTFLSKW